MRSCAQAGILTVVDCISHLVRFSAESVVISELGGLSHRRRTTHEMACRESMVYYQNSLATVKIVVAISSEALSRWDELFLIAHGVGPICYGPDC